MDWIWTGILIAIGFYIAPIVVTFGVVVVVFITGVIAQLFDKLFNRRL